MKMDLIDEAKRLSVPERIELVEAIWSTVAEEAGAEDLPPLTATQAKELDRRIDEWRTDPDGGSPWEEVRARLEKAR